MLAGINHPMKRGPENSFGHTIENYRRTGKTVFFLKVVPWPKTSNAACVKNGCIAHRLAN